MSEQDETPQEDEQVEEQDEQVESQEEEAEESGDEQEDAAEFDRDKVRAKLRKLNSENRNLRQQKKDAEEKAKASEGKSEQLQALEAKNARYETLAEHDLPLRLSKFITATDPEEILEQAEELLSLGSSKAPPQDQPKERLRQSRKAAPVDEMADPDKFMENVFRR